jgi:hypothetical protein
MTSADAFWATKIVLELKRAHLEAAVKQGGLSDERASRYLVDTLLARARRIGEAYMLGITALDRFEVSDGLLCMRDLSVTDGLVEHEEVEVGVDGNDLNEGVRADADHDGRVCVTGPGDRDYVVFKLRTARLGSRHTPIEVHVHGGAQPHVIGIVRPL